MASKKFPLLAALLLSACSGSLIDHLGVDLGTGQFPDGGDAGCTGSSCQASCDCAPANATAQCDGNACSFTCNATFFRSGTACISPSRIAAGGDSTCAILQDATVSCWGQPLGAATTPSEVPAAVPGLTQVAHLAVGSGHACAVMLDNATINCWGNNDSGQLGTPAATAASAEAPGITTTLTSVSDIVVGDHHTCALTSAGAVCWGANDVGQLGDGSTSPNAGRNTVVNTAGATGISGGKRHTCVSINGGVSCWGSDDSGQI
ncbi:MAG TPA: hypothetical protein VH083_18700, partial [Myxococcales bacterium]|nr:hypothetical protein [Myxococcales bacterium]